jgi:excisionase family DNA binding protein
MQEAAGQLGVSYTTVQRLVSYGRIGTLPGMRIRMIPLDEIERYLESARVEVSA